LAIAAAEAVASDISVEVIDPRTIKPMDFDLIVASVEKTGRLVVAEESPITGNVGAEIVARCLEMASRPVAVCRVAMPDMIHPYSASMETGIMPDRDDIIAALRRIKRGDRHFPAFAPRWERQAS
jgi:pyruvate dehydrogenase E1 component beta subunit